MKKIVLFLVLQIFPLGPLCAQDLTGTWRGTVHSRAALHITLEIGKLENGLKASLTVDDNGQHLPIESLTVKGSNVRFSSQVLASSYEGKVSADGKSIVGFWVQDSNRQPLSFSRVVSDETSNRSDAISRPLPMASDVVPSFEVATIKPSNPDAGDKHYWSDGRHYRTSGTSLRDLLQVAYGIKPRQILGLPAWAEEAKYDLEAEFAVTQGMPSNQQFQQMLQKLLIERFSLSVHRSQKEFRVYALVVGSRGTNLKPHPFDPGARHRAFLSPGTGGGRLLIEKDATTSDLVSFLMSQLPDRQIVDGTSLTGSYDFQLNFVSQGTQVSSGSSAESQSPDVGAAPYLPQALEEQLGLKLISSKAMIPVLIVDKVEVPSAN